jgi:predicted DNA-binding transcriptional regulator AlpA
VELQEWLKIGKSTIYKYIENGSLPKPIKIGDVSLWFVDEVNTAIHNFAKNRAPTKLNKSYKAARTK